MSYNDTGSNILTVRENNLSVIIRYMHKIGICTRANIAEYTGLKHATITYIINDLMEWGLVEETGTVEGKMNRRSVGIRLSGSRYRIIGIRINRKYITAGFFSIDGKLLEMHELTLNGQSPSYIIQKVKDLISEYANKYSEFTILGAGIAIPGPYNSKTGCIELITGFSGWENINIAEQFKSCFDFPVFIEHDANCGALGELWYGDTESHKNIVFIAADRGIGAGILIDGNLYCGELGIAGEIGHMSIDYSGEKCVCGNRGCLEMYCSTLKLKHDYKQALICNEIAEQIDEKLNYSTEQILQLVASGDKTACEAFRISAVFLALGLVNIVNIFNPSLLILSDRLSIAGDILVKTVSETLEQRLLPSLFKSLAIRLGTPVEDIVLYGANALVMENILLSPTAYFKPENM